VESETKVIIDCFLVPDPITEVTNELDRKAQRKAPPLRRPVT
jgi:hypothetical protein